MGTELCDRGALGGHWARVGVGSHHSCRRVRSVLMAKDRSVNPKATCMGYSEWALSCVTVHSEGEVVPGLETPSCYGSCNPHSSEKSLSRLLWLSVRCVF